MAWSHDDQPDHKGYIVGQTRKDEDSSYVAPSSDFSGTLDVETVQATCQCGWRSARYRAPFGTTCASGAVDLPTSRIGLRKKDGLRRLWLEHVDAIANKAKHEEIDDLGEPVVAP